MKKEDFYGKYITGENGPVEITEELCKNHKILTKRILEHLNKVGLIHDSFDAAMIAYNSSKPIADTSNMSNE